MRLGFYVAFRFLRSNKGQSILIILGIAIGVSVQIFIGSLIQGLQKGLIEKTIGSSSQITIQADNSADGIVDYQQVVDKIPKADENVTAVNAVLDNAAFLEYEGESQSLLVRGFDFKAAEDIYHLSDRIEEGRYPTSDNEIILGIDLKDKYGLELQDEVNIVTTNQKTVSCRVVGFFDLKVANLNTGWGITSLGTARSIFEAGDKITSIEMQVSEAAVFSADEISQKIKAALQRPELTVTNWMEENESLLSGLQGQSISSYMIQVFVMISVVLGIASVLAVTVMQKSKQIGILKAVGNRNLSTSFIFLFEGLILGFFGTLLGILLGLGLSYSFTRFAVNPDGTPVVNLYINDSFILISGLIALAASELAALLPAVRSAKLNPIDIIRNN